MNKPFSVANEEFKQELTNLINNSGLPFFVIELILQNYLNEVDSIAKNQYKNDKAQYEQSLLEKNKNNKDEKSDKK